MCNSNLSSVVYDRKDKEYRISFDGVVYASFPSGQEGASAAGQTAIQHDDPQVYAAAFYLANDLFRTRPEIQKRVWKAALAIIQSRVFAAHPLCYQSNITAHVAAQNKEGFYTVKRFDNHYTCECFDYINYTAPKAETQPLCKHILAIKLHKIIDRPLPPYLDSPKDLMPWLDEAKAQFLVIGVYNRSEYTAYPEPVYRRPVISEVIMQNGRFLRLIGHASKIQSYDVTEELQEPDRRGFNRMKKSESAHLLTSYRDMPPPRPTEENEELTAALISMTAAAHKNYPSKTTKATMTDLSAAETNALLFD